MKSLGESKTVRSEKNRILDILNCTLTTSMCDSHKNKYMYPDVIICEEFESVVQIVKKIVYVSHIY